MNQDLLVTRRRLVAAASGLLPAVAAAGTDRLPDNVGRKFNADGSVRRFAGNSFVGHVGQQGEDFEVFDALLDIYRELPLHPFARKLAVLPPSSYHVTLMGGINDADRRTVNWPADIPREAPMEEVNRICLDRLSGWRAGTLTPCDFVVDVERPPRPRTEGTLGLPLRPADAAAAAKLGAARDRLADLIGLRRPDHDSYRYHVTIGYLFEFLTPAESAAMQAATVAWMTRIAALQRPVRIRSFDFCVLRDMYAFRAVRAV